jgi:hypothetical protein
VKRHKLFQLKFTCSVSLQGAYYQKKKEDEILRLKMAIIKIRALLKQVSRKQVTRRVSYISPSYLVP